MFATISGAGRTIEIRSDRPGVGRATSDAVALAVSLSFINGERVVAGPVAEAIIVGMTGDATEAGATLTVEVGNDWAVVVRPIPVAKPGKGKPVAMVKPAATLIGGATSNRRASRFSVQRPARFRAR